MVPNWGTVIGVRVVMDDTSEIRECVDDAPAELIAYPGGAGTI